MYLSLDMGKQSVVVLSQSSTLVFPVGVDQV